MDLRYAPETVKRWIKIVSNAILGGGFLIGLIILVYTVGQLLEGAS